MLGRFPQFIDLVRYCESRKTLEGNLSFKFCQRLAGEIGTSDGEIAFVLNFGIDEFGNRHVSGSLDTSFQLVCQRCMEDFQYPCHIDLGLAFIATRAEEEKIQGMYESYFYEDSSRIDLHALMEDEVMLALPLIAKHELADCSIDEHYSTDDLDENSMSAEQVQTAAPRDDSQNSNTEQAEVAENPFAILKQLKD